MTQLDTPRTLGDRWTIDPDITFLNHGSFGACPREVIAFQQAIRDRIERQPVQFFERDWEGLLDEARARLAAFLGADADDLAFVNNATAGVNAVLRSLRFEPGDELLVTDHEYNACANALRFVAQRWGATVVVVSIPFPIQSPGQVFDAIMAGATDRTKLALIDHVTSPTALIFPIERLVNALQSRSVDVLVDGAHAPGMLPLNLNQLGAAYYTGNLHKWVGAPKGAAFLRVRSDRQEEIAPTSISHGYNSARTDRSRFRLLFDWTGTTDPSAWLSAPAAIDAIGAMAPGGWDEVMRRNHDLALAGRRIVLEKLGLESPAPEEMIGSMASIVLPDRAGEIPETMIYADALHDLLWTNYRIEVPVPPWPAPPKRMVRLSAHLYNSIEQYDRLAEAIRIELEKESQAV